MTPGKVRRVPGTAGKLTAATLLWKPTWDRCRYPSAAACETSISVCGTDPRTGEEELLWRAAATRPCAQTNCHPSRDRCVPSPLRPVTENNRKWFLLTGIIRPTQQKTLMRTFSSSANSHSAIKVMWQHLKVWVWPTFQVASESHWCQSSQQKPCKGFLRHPVALLGSNTHHKNWKKSSNLNVQNY